MSVGFIYPIFEGIWGGKSSLDHRSGQHRHTVSSTTTKAEEARLTASLGSARGIALQPCNLLTKFWCVYWCRAENSQAPIRKILPKSRSSQ